MRRFIEYIGFVVFIMLLSFLVGQNSFAAPDPSLSVKGMIDSPSSNSSISGEYTINGWFLDASGVEKIEVFIDGQIIGQARYGLPRVDVNQAYPKYESINSGFEYVINTKTLTRGTHTLLIKETGKNGKQVALFHPINVTNAKALGMIDAPKPAQEVNGEQKVQGWFLDGSGVKHVEVFVDGQIVGRAATGQPRPDVSQAYPQYQTQNSGYKYTINTNQLKRKQHELLVKETGENGEQIALFQPFNVNTLPTLGVIDSPAPNAGIEGTYTVNGWFLDGSGVKAVEVFIDGQIVGQADYGLLRTDVANAYPQYQNSHSGFEFSLNTKNLKRGNHKLLVKETGSNGEQVALFHTINVNNPSAIGVIDSPTVHEPIEGKYKISGWFLDGSDVQRTEVFIDGKIIGQANYGFARPDVNKAYSKYNSVYSGFEYILDADTLSGGIHNLLVKETGSNGEQIALFHDIYKVKNGVDVSHYQGAINYSAVKQSGQDFVIAKATEGQSYKDPTLDQNINAARNAGLETHVYHFFRAKNSNEARSEANYFAQQYKRLNLDGYAFLDVETTNGLNQGKLSESVNDFLNQLKANGITKIGVYSGMYFLNNSLDMALIKSNNPGLLVWTARYRGKDTDLGPGTDTDLWQYTSSGQINGIIGNVDLDKSYDYKF